jgi:glycosyltransferase involved in cell wall biosynthesis
MPREEARRKLGWSQSELVVLINVGSDPINKGLDVAKEAVRIAGEKVGPIRLHVLRGEVAPDLVPLHINASNCVLLASRYEGSPNVVKEAMACNVPVVACSVGDVAKRLRGVFPSKVTSRDPAELGSALAEVLSLNQRSNGRDNMADFTTEATTRRLLALYATVTRPPGASEGSR